MASLAVSFDAESRRAFRRLLAASALAHLALALALAVAPIGRTSTATPGVIRVDLVAMPGGAAPAAAAPKPARPPQPAPAPAPKPEAPARKPVLQKQVVLPTEPRQAPEPAPEKVAKREVPKPAPEPAPPRPEPQPATPPAPPEQALDYEDLLAKLRAEQGEARPERVEVGRVGESAAAGAASGAPVGPEVAAWVRDARNHVRRAWVLAPGFRTEPLETHVEVELDAEGQVLGEPRVTRRSGNPWYDESVVRAVQKASPLPRPPEAGTWPFVFRPEDF